MSSEILAPYHRRPQGGDEAPTIHLIGTEKIGKRPEATAFADSVNDAGLPGVIVAMVVPT